LVVKHSVGAIKVKKFLCSCYLKTISPALKGDHYTAFSMMLEDKEAVKKAEIEVENINGSILLISGINDQWPATEMSDQIVKRLQQNNFTIIPH
jgi:hypothetical protein